MNQKSKSEQLEQVKLLAPNWLIKNYIREIKRFSARTASAYRNIKNNRIKMFENLLEKDCKHLCGSLGKKKIGAVIRKIIYMTCVEGIVTISAKRLGKLCKCSISTVGRAINVLRESKQYLIGYENEVGKGRYIIVDTLCDHYTIMMDYVFRMHKSIYTKLAYNNTVEKKSVF